MENIVAQTEAFVHDAFLKHPHYSFNDWTIMYNHSVRVKDTALQIAKHVPCDGTALAIGALLHDIGKTYVADETTLRQKHENFNIVMSEKFLQTLELPPEQLEKIKEAVAHTGESVELKIIEDADTLAFFADKILYTAFANWAKDRGLFGELERKLKKFDRLNFAYSKELGKPWFVQIQQDWRPLIETVHGTK
ncbi:MAG: HD domain-containing protein [Patescibacteria group bacterium]|nr:HD domain-containing protein [Patescibacteria group bacterium]